MRVGIYIDKQRPEGGGGYTFAAAMLRGLERQGIGYDCVIFNGGRDPLEPTPVGIPTVEIRAGSSARWRKHRHRLLRLVKQARGHPINGHLIEHGIDFLWLLTPAHLDNLAVPYAFTVWDLAHREHPYFPEVSAKRNWRVREDFYSHMVPRASLVVVGNERGREEVARYYGVARERIVAIEMPAPDMIAEPNRMPSGRPYLFYPAQFWAHKNHVNAMLGLKWARERHGLDIDLVFTGSDRGNAEFVRDKASELGLGGNVHFRGFVGVDEIASLYANALGLLYLSFFGPDNLPPLEAFTLGCPVIASRIPGHVEQLGDAAIFASPTSPDEIGDAIKRLHEDGALREALVVRGRKIAAERTVDRYLAKMKAAIDGFAGIRRAWPLASRRAE